MLKHPHIPPDQRIEFALKRRRVHVLQVLKGVDQGTNLGLVIPVFDHFLGVAGAFEQRQLVRFGVALAIHAY